MNVDTGAFEALTAQVAGLAAALHDLRAEAFVNAEIMQVILRTQTGYPVPAVPARRPRHLHAVAEGAR